jgi:hypothetical protein
MAKHAVTAAKRTADALDAFAKAGPRVPAVAVPAVVKTLNAYAYGDDERKKKLPPQEAARARIEEIARASADPAGTSAKVKERLQGIAATSPKMAEMMAAVEQRKMAFLAAKMPKAAAVGDAITGYRDGKLSGSDLSKFARYLRAVEDPDTVLSDMAGGRLTTEAVEALREVYPETYREIQMGLVERLAELQDKLPYEKRLQVSILFGVPVDSSMRPEMVRTLQSTFASEPNTEGGTRPPRADLGDVKAPTATQAQKLAE